MAIRHWHLDSGAIRINNFPENEIQIAIPIALMSDMQTIAIDSTGIKYVTAHFKTVSEMFKHVKYGMLVAKADAPSATDAIVHVELVDINTGNILTYLEYAGDSGEKTVIIDSDTLKSIAGNYLQIRLNVTTASATAGATQRFTTAELIIVLGIS